PMPHLDSLPDRDKSEWAVVDGKAQDPWQPCYRMLLIEMAVPHGDVTFSGGAYGTELALRNLCLHFSQDRHLYPEAMPVVSLGTHTRHSKAYGDITGPAFDIRGWATVEDVKAGRKKRVKATPITKEALAREIDEDDPARV